MEYVSAEWVDNDMGGRTIKATGDDGSIWWVPSLDCDVPPFPAFLQSEAGKAFRAASPQPEKSATS